MQNMLLISGGFSTVIREAKTLNSPSILEVIEYFLSMYRVYTVRVFHKEKASKKIKNPAKNWFSYQKQRVFSLYSITFTRSLLTR